MGRKSRLKKSRQHDALAKRYESGAFDVPPDPDRVERRRKLLIVVAFASVMLTLTFVGEPGRQQTVAPVSLLGGGIVAALLRRDGHRRLSATVLVIAALWFLALLFVSPDRLAVLAPP